MSTNISARLQTNYALSTIYFLLRLTILRNKITTFLYYLPALVKAVKLTVETPLCTLYQVIGEY